MSRSLTVRRPTQPDAKYNSVLVTRLINKIMQHGKKELARRIVYNALENIRSQGYENPLEVLEQAEYNLSPEAEIRKRKVGGATYDIPREPREQRKAFLALYWLRNKARTRSEYTMEQRLANEIIAASKNEGAAIQEKVQIHKIAENNKAFSSFNW